MLFLEQGLGLTTANPWDFHPSSTMLDTTFPSWHKLGRAMRENAFRGDWLVEQGGLETSVSREGFLREKGHECWRYYTSKSTSIQRMSSHSVRYDVRR
jgi:hypothetical protein